VALTLALGFGFVGGFQLLGLDGLLGVMVGVTVYALVVEGPKRNDKSQLQETVDLIFSTTMFVLFGAAIPFGKWSFITWWRGLILATLLLIFRRVPWVCMFYPLLKKQLTSISDLIFAAWFGPVGVAAIFYSIYASEKTGDDLGRNKLHCLHPDCRLWTY